MTAEALQAAPVAASEHPITPIPLRGIVIGLGHQGLKHAQTIALHPDAVLVGGIDISVDSQQAFCSNTSWEGTPTWDSLPELIDEIEEPPDFAILAVPHDQHLEAAEILSVNSIPFLKEKPLARNLDEAARLMSISGIRQYCFPAIQRRFSQLDKSIGALIDQLDEPERFHYIYSLGLEEIRAGWRNDLSVAGGGSFLDMGYHVMARICDWFGEPVRVQSIMGTHKESASRDQPEDMAVLFMEFDSGVAGWVCISPISAIKEEDFLISCVESDFIHGDANRATLYNIFGHKLDSVGTAGENLEYSQLTYFLNKVRSAEGFNEDLEFNQKVMSAIDKCYKARVVSL